VQALQLAQHLSEAVGRPVATPAEYGEMMRACRPTTTTNPNPNASAARVAG
jgi:hypothetical protein